jgi:hypothetical protein
MGGVTRTIKKAVKKVAAPIVKVAEQTPIAKDVLKVANDPLRAVRPGGGLAQSQRPDTFAGAPKEVIAAAESQVQQTIKEATGLGPTPKAATAAGGAETQTQAQRRRGRRGIRTGSRGVMGSAPVEKKSLLGG